MFVCLFLKFTFAKLKQRSVLFSSKKHTKWIIPNTPIRGRNKAGPRANCPQILVRALKRLRPRAQMAHENVGLLPYLMYKRYNKNHICPWKNKIEALIFEIPGPKWPLKFLAYFIPCCDEKYHVMPTVSSLFKYHLCFGKKDFLRQENCKVEVFFTQKHA